MQRAANVSYPNESGRLVGGGQTATDSNRCNPVLDPRVDGFRLVADG